MNASAAPPAISSGQTARIRVNLTRLSNGTDTAGGGTFVPDEIPVAYDRTHGTGRIAPQAGTITSGANTTRFTPAGIGTSTVSATVDGQTVSVYPSRSLPDRLPTSRQPRVPHRVPTRLRQSSPGGRVEKP